MRVKATRVYSVCRREVRPAFPLRPDGALTRFAEIRRAGRIDKDGPFHPSSLVQQLMERYGC